MSKRLIVLTSVVLMAFCAIVMAEDAIPIGEKVKMEGVIIERSGNSIVLLTHRHSEVKVIVSPGTTIQERKKNPFRPPVQYGPDHLMVGLNVRVKGHGDTSGALLAEEIKFTKSELKIAETITSQTLPLESRVEDTETRLRVTESALRATSERLESKTNRLEGQVEELDGAFHLVRGEAEKAQLSADEALNRVDLVQERITDLDRYEKVGQQIVAFAFNSYKLSDAAKTHLDSLAVEVKPREGYLIQVVGFTSSDGNTDYNKKLSRKRADVVVDYLVEKHAVPLWRIVRPFGLGESLPVADNSTLEGRKQNRRVEVTVLQSRGQGNELADYSSIHTPDTYASSGIK